MSPEDSLKIVIGQCRQGRISVEGQILLFTVRQKGNGHPSICEPRVYKLDGDHPKDVDFSPNGTLFLCRTELRNNVLVWELPSDSSANERSISINKSSYTQVSEAQGVLLDGVPSNLSDDRKRVFRASRLSRRIRPRLENNTCFVQRLHQANDAATKANGPTVRQLLSHLDTLQAQASTI